NEPGPADGSRPRVLAPVRGPRQSDWTSTWTLPFSLISTRFLTLSRYCSGTLSTAVYFSDLPPSWTVISPTLALPSDTLPVTVLTRPPSWWRVVKRSLLRTTVVVTPRPPGAATAPAPRGSLGTTPSAGGKNLRFPPRRVARASGSDRP